MYIIRLTWNLTNCFCLEDLIIARQTGELIN